jgi:ribosomal protein S18 acetylase RimI-like enzyme
VIHIRKAEPADFDVIWPLLRDVFRAGQTYAVDPAISRDAAFAYWMQTPQATFVALADDQVIGTYYLRPNQPGFGGHICNCGYITAAAARGQGVAEQMCRHSLDAARAFGYRAMQFNFVLASNTGALRLWARLGFAIVGTIPDAYDHPDHGLVAAHVMYQAL